MVFLTQYFYGCTSGCLPESKREAEIIVPVASKTAFSKCEKEAERTTEDHHLVEIRIKEVTRITNTGDTAIKMIECEVYGNMSFVAGQCVTIHPPETEMLEDEFNNRREAYECRSDLIHIASSPSSLPRIRFCVTRRLDNEFSVKRRMYHRYRIGDKLFVDDCGEGSCAVDAPMLTRPGAGPRGICLITGGLGIIGVIGIIEELLLNPAAQSIPSICLIHSNRSNSEIPFYDQFSSLAACQRRFEYCLRITEELGPNEECKGEPGRIDLLLLREKVQGKLLFCISGPRAFEEDVEDMLQSLGVPRGFMRPARSWRALNTHEPESVPAPEPEYVLENRAGALKDDAKYSTAPPLGIPSDI